MFKKDSLLLYSFGGLAFVITAFIFWNYFTPEWKGRDEVADRARRAAA